MRHPTEQFGYEPDFYLCVESPTDTVSYGRSDGAPSIKNPIKSSRASQDWKATHRWPTRGTESSAASNRSTLSDTFRMWDALRLDVRHSFRSLRRAPTFSLIVVVTLALAVGATMAVGSLLNALVLRTLAVPSPEQLVALSALEPRVNVSGYFYADTFKAYRSAQRSFAQMSMYSGGGLLRVEARSGGFDAWTEAVSPNSTVGDYSFIDPF